MKKIFTLLIGIVFSITILNAQTPPQAFSYKAVIMKANGNSVLSNTTISLRISILQGSTIGAPVYSQTLNPTTNKDGQIDIVIGGGTSFSSIDWFLGDYFLKTEVDTKGGTNYQLLSITQLLSVPYALYADKAGSAINESDPIFVAHPAHGITSGNISNWNTAYGWGNHAGLYRPIGYVPAWSEITGKPITISGYGITDAVTATGNQIILGNKMFSNDLSINGLTVGLGAGAVFHNTVIGFHALHANTTGAQNTVNGFEALYDNTTGGNNTVNGYGAMARNTIGSYNTASGYDALYSNMTGNFNTAYGSLALGDHSAGNYNTAIGDHALFLNTSGENNTANGYNAGYSNIGNNNVFLGSSAGYYETGSNKLFIDNQERTNESDARNKALIYGVFDADPANQVLTVNGTLKMQNLNITNLANPVNAQDAATKAYVDAAVGGATTHSIGESYGGGIVFFVYDNGQHGLIAATADQIRGVGGVWTNTVLQTTVSNAVRDGVNGGLTNTERIIIQAGAGSYAAQLCANYQGGNYADWYLPSKYELNLLLLQKDVVRGFDYFIYWSSTEGDNGRAWAQLFDSGYQYLANKTSTAYVRAIRAF